MSQSQAAAVGISAPKSEPQVPGPGLRRPTPRTVAMASARRSFLRGASGAVVASTLGVIGVVEIEGGGLAVAFDLSFFVENRVGDHIFFAGPVAQVAVPAALAAKREVRM